jgi:hypothetical protein
MPLPPAMTISSSPIPASTGARTASAAASTTPASGADASTGMPASGAHPVVPTLTVARACAPYLSIATTVSVTPPMWPAWYRPELMPIEPFEELLQ